MTFLSKHIEAALIYILQKAKNKIKNQARWCYFLEQLLLYNNVMPEYRTRKCDK